MTTTTAEGRLRRPWRFRAGDRFATPLEPVEVLAALSDDPAAGAGPRFVPAAADPLLLEWTAPSGLRAEVRLDERTAGGCRVRCRVLERGRSSDAELDELHRRVRRLIERAEGRATSAVSPRAEQAHPYSRTGWLPRGG